MCQPSLFSNRCRAAYACVYLLPLVNSYFSWFRSAFLSLWLLPLIEGCFSWSAVSSTGSQLLPLFRGFSCSFSLSPFRMSFMSDYCSTWHRPRVHPFSPWWLRLVLLDTTDLSTNVQTFVSFLQHESVFWRTNRHITLTSAQVCVMHESLFHSLTHLWLSLLWDWTDANHRVKNCLMFCDLLLQMKRWPNHLWRAPCRQRWCCASRLQCSTLLLALHCLTALYLLDDC